MSKKTRINFVQLKLCLRLQSDGTGTELYRSHQNANAVCSLVSAWLKTKLVQSSASQSDDKPYSEFGVPEQYQPAGDEQ